MATFDNSYRKCYNKRSDNNKKAICHQTAKFALQDVFAFGDIKSRRTPENAVQRIYINLHIIKPYNLHTIITTIYTTNLHTNTTPNKHFLFMCKKSKENK